MRGPALAAVLVLITGCASRSGGRPVQAPLPPPSETGTPACFHADQAQDFRSLDRSNLIVYAPSREHAYHLRIAPASPELRFTDRLAFLPRDARICGRAGDRLLVNGAGASQTYSIIDVSRLTEPQLAALLALASGDGPAVPSPAPAPAAGEGAEVERDIGGRD